MQTEGGAVTYSGSRTFQYVRPRAKRATEYEDVTQYVQQDASMFAVLGWPTRFRGGRPPYADETTKLRSSDWWAVRDPSKRFYRSYVANHAAQEQAIDALVDLAQQNGTLAALPDHWVDRVIGPVYGAYACLEWGLFRALSFAQREARSDMITVAAIFNAGDKLRHAHDISLYEIELEEARPNFDTGSGKQAWLEEPALQGAREVVERLMYLKDWGEVIVATNLVFEPLLGRFIRTHLLGRHASVNGDGVTPILLASADADASMNLEFTKDFVRTMLQDETHGGANRTILAEWIDQWGRDITAACEKAAPLFDRPETRVLSAPEALSEVREKQAALLTSLGLS